MLIHPPTMDFVQGHPIANQIPPLLININIPGSFWRCYWLVKKPVAREWTDEITCQSEKGRDLPSPDICKTTIHSLSVAVTRAKGLFDISYSNQSPARDGRSPQFEQMEEDSNEQMKPLLTTVSVKLFVVVASELRVRKTKVFLRAFIIFLNRKGTGMRETDGRIGLKHHFLWVLNDPGSSSLS